MNNKVEKVTCPVKRNAMFDILTETLTFAEEAGFKDSSEMLMYNMGVSLEVMYNMGGSALINEYCDKVKELYKNQDNNISKMVH